eukprot:TRINITY_DN6267_c0_g1_i1.p1 TRINITY_DN6267_c0_g1~~TRINITY_DN6267_c0_g1_i1.p1  ORF type:complete len:229 (-),score=48.34 TRINITY_DN6267_c0_g1_i1:329-1015(-)
MCVLVVFFFQAEDGIRDAQESRGLGDVYKRQGCLRPTTPVYPAMSPVPVIEGQQPSPNNPHAACSACLAVFHSRDGNQCLNQSFRPTYDEVMHKAREMASKRPPIRADPAGDNAPPSQNPDALHLNSSDPVTFLAMPAEDGQSATQGERAQTEEEEPRKARWRQAFACCFAPWQSGGVEGDVHDVPMPADPAADKDLTRADADVNPAYGISYTAKNAGGPDERLDDQK